LLQSLISGNEARLIFITSAKELIFLALFYKLPKFTQNTPSDFSHLERFIRQRTAQGFQPG
jgi:hypothetical protein